MSEITKKLNNLKAMNDLLLPKEGYRHMLFGCYAFVSKETMDALINIAQAVQDSASEDYMIGSPILKELQKLSREELG